MTIRKTPAASIKDVAVPSRLGKAFEPLALVGGSPRKADEQPCRAFYDAKLKGTTEEAGKCILDLHTNIPDVFDRSKTIDAWIEELKKTYAITTQDQIDEQLVTTHYLSRVLRKQYSGTLLSELDEVDRRIHKLMDHVGLLEPIAGSLVAGPAIGYSGKLASDATGNGAGGGGSSEVATSNSSKSKTNALTHIKWGSKHFGAEEDLKGYDFSFGGTFGLQPALSLLKDPDPAPASKSTKAATAEPKVTSEYQTAFVWDLNSKVNFHTGTTSELSTFVRAGQIRLMNGNGITVVDQGANSILKIPLNNQTDQFAWFWDGGVEWNYYRKQLELVHAEKGQLDPAFYVGLWYRLDNRFKKDNGVVGFDSPDRRLVFKFMVNGLKVFDRRPDTTASKPYSISFGIEHERGFGNRPVPSGTQIIIRGDINLLKLLNQGSPN